MVINSLQKASRIDSGPFIETKNPIGPFNINTTADTEMLQDLRAFFLLEKEKKKFNQPIMNRVE